MTVVCDSVEAKEALSKLTFQNINSGSSICFEKKILADGRIQLTYNVNMDRKYVRYLKGYTYLDTEDDYIQHLRLKKLENPAEPVITNNAELSFEVNLAQ